MKTSTPVRIVLRRMLLVAVGGMLGTAARLGLGMLIADAALGVLCANVVGSLLLGVVTARVPGPELRMLLGTGMLGGFTTYSALAVDSVGLWASSPMLAVAYAVGSVVLGLVAAAVGLWAGSRLGHGKGAA